MLYVIIWRSVNPWIIIIFSLGRVALSWFSDLGKICVTSCQKKTIIVVIKKSQLRWFSSVCHEVQVGSIYGTFGLCNHSIDFTIFSMFTAYPRWLKVVVNMFRPPQRRYLVPLHALESSDLFYIPPFKDILVAALFSFFYLI